MADINLKTATPDTSLPTDGFLFGADSQAASAPSVFTTQSVATTLLGSTSLTGATVTTSQPVLDLAQTWNASGVTFTGLKFNAATGSSANSAAGSLLMDLQLEGASRFSVKKDGSFGQQGVSGFYFERFNSSGLVGVTVSNTEIIRLFNDTTTANGAATFSRRISFSSTGSVSANFSDAYLTARSAANLRLGAADAGATTSTVTITIAAPGVVTWTNHGFSTGTPVVFTTTGALPTGITAGTTYYAVVVDANTFQIASSAANAIAAVPTVITTSGTQSGTHTGTRYNITQRLGMQSVTGVTDRLGADLLIQGSQGTGTGAGGSIIFQVAPAGSTGTAQNALATALTIASDGVKFQSPTSSKPIELNFGGTGGFGFYQAASYHLALGYASSGSGPYSTNYGFSIYGDSGFHLPNNRYIGWTSSNTVSGAVDTILVREAAGVTGVRGANTTTGGSLSFIEQTAPAAPAANGVRIYAVDNGSGKTQLMALFATGAAQQIAIEP